MSFSGLLRLSILTVLVAALLVGLPGVGQAEQYRDITVGFLVGPGVDYAQTIYPLEVLQGHGVRTLIIGVDTEAVRPHDGDTMIEVDLSATEISVQRFDALIIPGGESPALLEQDTEVIELVTEFYDRMVLIAAIGEGPVLLSRAGLLEGRIVTGSSETEEQLLKAGAEFVDQEVAIDRYLLSSRGSDDLPVFTETLSFYLMEDLIEE